MSPAVAETKAIQVRRPHAAGRRRVLLVGPQRDRPNLSELLRRHGIKGRLGVVTAGWQEREDEVEELESHLAGGAVSLQLHRRADEAFQADRELAELHHDRQMILQRLQRLYDVRLRYIMDAVADLERRNGKDESLTFHREQAMQSVRDLDREHLDRIREVHADWEAKLDLANRKSVIKAKRDVAALLGDCDGLAISGGHVAVLLNRLRFFDVLGALSDTAPIVAWSAGAMVVTERVVVYHDSPPQGPGNAEILETGLGEARDVVALPHAARRLRLDDAERVSRLARRLLPATCVAFDDGGSLLLDSKGCTPGQGVRVLLPDGRVTRMTS